MAQSALDNPLRGSGMPGAGDNLTPPTGTNAGQGAPLSGANELSRPPLALPADLTTPNYGKPRKRPDPRTKYSGARKPPGRQLPELRPYPGASTQRQIRATPATTEPPAPTRPAPTVAAIPTITAKPRPQVEADPWAPVGVSVGSLRLVPYIDEQIGYDTNPNRLAPPVKGSAFERTEVGAVAQSDWSVHDFKGDLRLGYTRYQDAPTASRPDGAAKLNWRVDATRDTALEFELRGQLDTQRPGSPDLTPTGLASRPFVTTVGATAGATHKVGDLEFGVYSMLDRTFYEDATLNNGTTVALAGNSYNTYGLRGRVGYQITPGVKPFLEVGADFRGRDQALDSNGYARNSIGAAPRIGSSFELTRQLTGEISLGYAQRAYADKRLANLGGATVDASLIWTASPLTTVSLRGTTALNETTIAASSGAVNRALTLNISHALLRNMTIGAVGAIGVNEYKGVNTRETTLSGGLNAEYKFNRSFSVRGSFTHERLSSTTPGRDYTANVFLLGLRFQR
jgi:hypothetical protein